MIKKISENILPLGKLTKLKAATIKIADTNRYSTTFASKSPPF